MKKITKPKKETILKSLIIIGIIAILVSLYIQYGKPYLNELSLERQDQVRIKDLDTLNGIMKDVVSASSTQSIGNSNTIYISIPSDSSTCANLDLPATPDGWSYHCVATSTLNNTNGTGWIPVDVSGKISKLPVDAVNKAETLNYYAYVASSSEYVIAGVLDSRKYLKERAQGDDGVDDIRYEVGANTRLWGDAEGLVIFLPISGIQDSTIYDKSNYNNSTQIINSKERNGNELHFDGKNYILISNSKILEKIGSTDFSYTIITSFKSDVVADQSITEKWIGTSYPFSIRGPYPNIQFALYDGKQNPAIASTKEYSDNKWHQIVAGRDTTNRQLFLFIDGSIVGNKPDDTNEDISNKGPFPVGGRNLVNQNNFTGNIRGFYIYNRILKSQEIKRIYNSSL